MLTKLQDHLIDLLETNKLKEFFVAWKEGVGRQSPRNTQFRLLKADWGQLKEDKLDNQISAERAGLERSRILKALFQLVDQLTASDLPGAAPGQSPPPPPAADPLADLRERKLLALKRELLLATDAAVKFRLKIQIQELEDGGV